MTITIPCYPVVRAYLEANCERTHEGLQLNGKTVVTSMAMEMLEGKRKSLRGDGLMPVYRDSVTLVVSQRSSERGSWGMSAMRVRDFNTLIKDHVHEQVYMAMLCILKVAPAANIREYMGVYLAENQLYQNVTQLDSMIRNFLNWRKRKYPGLIRKRGRYHNYMINNNSRHENSFKK